MAKKFWLMRRILLLLLGLIASVASAQESIAWRQNFDKGLEGWGELRSAWGTENGSFHEQEGIVGKFMRVNFPVGSLDPATMRKEGKPYGGMGFKKRVFDKPQECARLIYKLRFAPDFDFVRGGKLPGLYGGTGNSGGKIPTGADGFSTRYMWLAQGRGQVYAYLPTSVNYGTSIGKGQFKFIRGVWNTIGQEVTMNHPGLANGRLRVWLNNQLVVDQSDLRFRDIPSLGIDGLFFDTFFGGNDDSWRSRQETNIDFAEMSVGRCHD